jgi:four helix bundle protein
MNSFNYKKLIAWQKSIELTVQIYLLTETLPKNEEYTLKSQLRRASVSVSSNLAEGSARTTEADRKRFYTIARSSIIEIDSQLETCVKLKYLTENDCNGANPLIEEIYRITSKLISK